MFLKNIDETDLMLYLDSTTLYVFSKIRYKKNF